MTAVLKTRNVVVVAVRTILEDRVAADCTTRGERHHAIGDVRIELSRGSQIAAGGGAIGTLRELVHAHSGTGQMGSEDVILRNHVRMGAHLAHAGAIVTHAMAQRHSLERAHGTGQGVDVGHHAGKLVLRILRDVVAGSGEGNGVLGVHGVSLIRHSHVRGLERLLSATL